MAEKTVVPNVVDRLGAALVAPRQALAAAELPAAAGRAPGDLAVLVLAGFAATHILSLTRAGWMIIDGDGMGAVHALLGQISAAVRAPLMFVLAGGALVAVLAGKRRSIGTDFDLACVAAVPLGAIAVLLELAARALPLAWWVNDAGVVLGCGWGAVILGLAVRQARAREAT
jgi:hypothetical protein